MRIQDRLLGGCSSFRADIDDVEVDFDSLIWRLLLFDNLVLVSTRLKEIPHFCRAFGVSGTIDLLSSGALSIQCDATTVGQTGQLAILKSRQNKGLLPLGSYSFSVICPHDRDDYIRECLSNLRKVKTQSFGEDESLRGQVRASIVERPGDYGLSSLEQLKQDLIDNDQMVKALVKRALFDRHNLIAHTDQFALTFKQIDEEDFYSETDLGRRFSLSEQEVHKIVESAVLALSSIHRRFEDMNTYNAIPGSIDTDLPLFQEKLTRLARELSIKDAEASFRRVIELRNMPTYDRQGTDAKIDIGKLLKARESSACREFREFLPRVADLSDREICELFEDLKSKVSCLLQNPSTKVFRFLASSALGLIAGVPGVIVGSAAGAIDSFIIDRVFQRSGLLMFINKQYPAIFR